MFYILGMNYILLMSAKRGYGAPNVTQYGTVAELTEEEHNTEKCGSAIDTEVDGVGQGIIRSEEECERL